MESLDGLGRELVWGLLALQQQFVSPAALAAALGALRGRPEQPLGQILLEQQALDPERAALVDAAMRDVLEREESDPVKMFQAVALGEALTGVLVQVADAEWANRLRQAARAVGLHEAGTTSLTVTSPPDGTVGLAARNPILDHDSTVPSDAAGNHVKLPATTRDPDNAPGVPDDLAVLIAAASVPEPQSLVLGGIAALLGLGVALSRRSANQSAADRLLLDRSRLPKN
jgi:hypothetical protein